MSLGQQMKTRRKELGLSRAALAEKLGVTLSAISNYENGISSPKEEILLRLARREIRLEAVIEGKAKLPQKPVKQQEVQQSPESETQNLQAAQLPENLRKAFNALGGSVTDISDQ